MHKVDGLAIYKEVKAGRKSIFDEEKHCSMILNIMGNDLKGTMSAFCVEAGISDSTFYDWAKSHEIFRECYALAKMFARENWEAQGREICEEVTMPGTSNHKFEYWRMIGWSRFGVGKNSRIRLDLDPNGTPNEHYGQLLKQASNGDFTAGEIKQLMEAVNVGLSTHQVFELQKEIDQLKFDLTVMNENGDVHNTFADKSAQKKD
jgi:hypothetical protein